MKPCIHVFKYSQYNAANEHTFNNLAKTNNINLSEIPPVTPALSFCVSY